MSRARPSSLIPSHSALESPSYQASSIQAPPGPNILSFRCLVLKINPLVISSGGPQMHPKLLIRSQPLRTRWKLCPTLLNQLRIHIQYTRIKDLCEQILGLILCALPISEPLVRQAFYQALPENWIISVFRSHPNTIHPVHLSVRGEVIKRRNILKPLERLQRVGAVE
jgi:hypothetical protein